jgi:elongation factor P
MASYGMNDVKNGLKILVNNDPCVITETEYVKPGKGQAFTRLKYRSIKSGRVVELTMKATDNLEAADVMDTDMQFLYADGEYWHFMQQESFEQVQADKNAVGDAWKWLKGEEDCMVTLWNGSPIFVQPPNFVELRYLGRRRQAGQTGNRRYRAGAFVCGAGRNHQGRYPLRRICQPREVIDGYRAARMRLAG